MSRVGSSAITIPADVTLSNDGGVIVVKGKNGELSTSLHSDQLGGGSHNASVSASLCSWLQLASDAASSTCFMVCKSS